MLQMTFGVYEDDVRAVLLKNWAMVVNPGHDTVEQLTRAAWQSMGEKDRDTIANAAMDAYFEHRNEKEAAHAALRMYLISHRFLTYATRREFHHEQPGQFNVPGVSVDRRHLHRH